MTLEGVQSYIWCSEFSWQTVPCSWSTDSEAALTGSSPGTRDQHSPRRRGTQLLATMYGVGRHTQVSQIARGCIMQALPHKHRRLGACAGNADSQARVGCGCDWVVINVHTVYIPYIVLVTVMTSTATVVNRTRYAERLLPLGKHAMNGHVRRQHSANRR